MPKMDSQKTIGHDPGGQRIVGIDQPLRQRHSIQSLGALMHQWMQCGRKSRGQFLTDVEKIATSLEFGEAPFISS
jgi:hypothetical protein